MWRRNYDNSLLWLLLLLLLLLLSLFPSEPVGRQTQLPSTWSQRGRIFVPNLTLLFRCDIMMLLNKVITYQSKGVDQLGVDVGEPQVDDIVKIHVKGSFIARRPLFQLGGKKKKKKQFFVKSRRVEFLNTHMVGDTAFININIINNTNEEGHEGGDDMIGLLSQAVRDMKLGEAATFTFDASSLKNFKIFDRQIAKGLYKNIGDDAEFLIFKINCFRIVRGNTVHHRPNRNGTGGYYY